MCGCKDLGEALRRIHEGAAMIRTKGPLPPLLFPLPTALIPPRTPSGEAGTGNIIEAVRHARKVNDQIRRAHGMSESELYSYAKELAAPFELLRQVAREGRLPVVMFSAGGIATPADAAVRLFSLARVTSRGEANLEVFFAVDDAVGLRWSFRVSSLRPPICGSNLTKLFSSRQRLGHLQVLQPRRPRPRDRYRHDKLQRPHHPRRLFDGTRARDEGRGEPPGARKGNDGGPRVLDALVFDLSVNTPWSK